MIQRVQGVIWAQEAGRMQQTITFMIALEVRLVSLIGASLFRNMFIRTQLPRLCTVQMYSLMIQKAYWAVSLQYFLHFWEYRLVACKKCEKWKPIILRWMVWALVTAAIAGGLCQLSLNQGVLPVNKNIWSLSFVLATGSLGFILMTILYVIIDKFQLWDGVPFVYAGMNSILYLAL